MDHIPHRTTTPDVDDERTGALLRWVDATRDLHVHATLSTPLDVPAAVAAGADGVLLRAETLQLDLDRDGPSTLAAEVLAVLRGRMLTVRGLVRCGERPDPRLEALLDAVADDDAVGGLPRLTLTVAGCAHADDEAPCVRGVRRRVTARLGLRLGARVAVVSERTAAGVVEVLVVQPERVSDPRAPRGWSVPRAHGCWLAGRHAVVEVVAAAHHAGVDAVAVDVDAVLHARLLAARITGERPPRGLRRADVRLQAACAR